MSDFRNKVLVGNTVLYPKIIRRYLMKSHYFLCYDPKEEKLTLNVNHGFGGQVLLEIRQVSYESAAKLAEGLGLKGDGEAPLNWDAWNPILHLYHDGSNDAETLHVEMLKLSVPHTVHRGCETLGLGNGQGMHQPPQWSAAQMLQIIRETAEKYKDQLATTP